MIFVSEMMRNSSAQQLKRVCPTETKHPGCLGVQVQAGEPKHQCLKAHALNCTDYLGALSLPLVGLRVKITEGHLDQSWALMHALWWGSQDHSFGADVGEESGGGQVSSASAVTGEDRPGGCQQGPMLQGAPQPPPGIAHWQGVWAQLGMNGTRGDSGALPDLPA